MTLHEGRMRTLRVGGLMVGEGRSGARVGLVGYIGEAY